MKDKKFIVNSANHNPLSAVAYAEMPFQRPKFQNGISNLYMFLKSALKMQEIPFQTPKV